MGDANGAASHCEEQTGKGIDQGRREALTRLAKYRSSIRSRWPYDLFARAVACPAAAVAIGALLFLLAALILVVFCYNLCFNAPISDATIVAVLQTTTFEAREFISTHADFRLVVVVALAC
jgi:hypothetical protein